MSTEVEGLSTETVTQTQEGKGGARRRRIAVTYGLPLLVLFVFPWISGAYQLNLLAKFLTYAILALSLDLLWGYAGILSFAHGVFFGLGAYGLALTLTYLGHLPGATYLGFALALIVPAVLAIVLGYAMFSRRVGGVYFAIVTFAVGTILQSLTIVWIDFTGGLNGLYGFPSPRLGIPGLVELELVTGSLATYHVILVALVAMYLVVRWLTRSPFGQTLQAINDNEERVEFLGYDVAAIKITVFTISCALAGLAGALYVPVGFVSAEIMGILFSTAVIVWVAVGGRGTLYGAVIGALLVNYLQVYMSDVLVFYWFLLIGLFFIVVVVAWPDGIVGVSRRLARRLELDSRI